MTSSPTLSEKSEKLTADERRVVARANDLLPKYGGMYGVKVGALNQAVLLLGLTFDAAELSELEQYVGHRCGELFDSRGRPVRNSPGLPISDEQRREFPTCARWVAHEGDHAAGCSECWSRFHPEAHERELAVNAANPLCPIRNLPCVREGVGGMVGRPCVVRNVSHDRRQPWIVASVVGTRPPVANEGVRWLLRYPAGNEMVVDPRVVDFPRRRRGS